MQLVSSRGLAKLNNPMSQKFVILTSSCLDVKDDFSPATLTEAGFKGHW